ncbi:tRNA (5-methylaminomethyl-2-thiouridine)(34)-methyltransferase MnmD [Pararhodobacter sp. SW119]|uniref:tRNA (5-methylaminomethyl-2-thiouridine)(34)-methyltransferase MnmD n=1 Tax=Pararhodobacter sp. SW119 TaxID=2780075 RepID=UPI001ADFAF22|nr:tRNA (5-methylaminomethyl-2-thiouridine)(34)-methyltransferase MnmD [Pararhodobacter sp. SW119]
MSQPALTWTAAGTPVSARFDDPYYTDGAGLAEARHVFLSGNDLPARLRDGFHVAELGFGTGLNLLALLQAWRGPGTLRFTSFEAWPLSPAEMESALAPFGLSAAAALVAAWADSESAQPIRRFTLPGVAVEVHLGDARETLPGWPGRADAWFLDGFAPARNPELWEAGLMAEVARHTVPGGTFATYTAAGAVRRALAEAGFAVERQPGFGRKRHMSAGRLGPRP